MDYNGQDTVLTFENVEGLSITLEKFDFTDLDNLPSVESWNIIFGNETEGHDSYDVFNNHTDNQQTLWSGNSVTFLNNEDNTLSGTNTDDVINAMDGNDVVSGQFGDDLIRGESGNDTIYGDDPTQVGETYISTHIDVTYVSTTAGYKNSIGAYTIDSDGNILSVDIGIENQKSATSGDTFTMDINSSEVADVGYFILSNGYNNNKEFFDAYDSQDGSYSFVYKAGQEDERAATINDNPDDVSLVFSTNTETIVLNGNAYHSKTSLNHDGEDHVTETDNIDGTTRLGFEDLPNLGDADFTDVVVDVSVSHEEVYIPSDIEGGSDTLLGGEGDDILVGQGGNDTLLGGEGVDNAVFSGNYEDYDIEFNDDNSVTVKDLVEGRDGSDTLSGIEEISFNDTSISVDYDALELIENSAEANTDVGDGSFISVEANSELGLDINADVDVSTNLGSEVEVEVENKGKGQGKEKNNRGHGNNEDGVDNDNPGKGKGGRNADKDTSQPDLDENVANNDSAIDALNDFFGIIEEISDDSQSWLDAIDSNNSMEASSGSVEAGASWLDCLDGTFDDGGAATDIDGDNILEDPAVDLSDANVEIEINPETTII